MTKDEALKLALETLESIQAVYPCETVGKRITAIKEALAQPAPYMAVLNDRMTIDPHTGNVSIGTVAQPAPVQEPWKSSDTAHRPGGLPQDFIKHEVENEGDWSEWVNPDPEQYFMKCCDCGLVHEMQFKVVKYSEGDECEPFNDPNVQVVFRARRHDIAEKQEDSLAQTNWDNIPQAFNDWWNADYDDSTNPFRLNSPAYWAWSGWSAANKEKNT
jgi:hypothetical protein